MSSFRQLMMRKKEQIMYATIKGTLTENDGVFSGFSASNYLKLQQNFAPTGSWEVVTKITTGTTLTAPVRYIFGSWGNGNVVVGTTDGGKLKMFISTNGGSSYNISLTTTSSVAIETSYYVRFGFTGNKYYLEFSTDGINYVGRAEYSSTAKISSFPVYFGRVYANENIWNGDIDFSNSYIKLGSTKYNLQAVVGYTVIGSPTIVDGVVSGINASNYLTLPNYSGAYPSGKIAFTYDRQSSMNQILLVMQRSTLFSFRIRAIDRTLQISWVDSDNTQQSMIMSYSLVVGVYYSATWEVKSGKIFFTLFDSLGNILETKNQDISLEATTSGAGKIGWYSTSSYWQGSIDLNNTHIKDGNKLWFNGQQA